MCPNSRNIAASGIPLALSTVVSIATELEQAYGKRGSSRDAASPPVVQTDTVKDEMAVTFDHRVLPGL